MQALKKGEQPPRGNPFEDESMPAVPEETKQEEPAQPMPVNPQVNPYQPPQQPSYQPQQPQQPAYQPQQPAYQPQQPVYQPPHNQNETAGTKIMQKPAAKGPAYYKDLTGARKDLNNAKKDLSFGNVDGVLDSLSAASAKLCPYITE
jgi:hypothetical protein